MAMERRVLHMLLFLAVLLVAAASVATARELTGYEKAVVGDTESQPSTLHPGVSDDDELKKQQLAEGTQYSEVSDEGKSVEDNNSDEEELAEDNDDGDGFNDEDKKTNHHSKPPKKTNHHSKPPRKHTITRKVSMLPMTAAATMTQRTPIRKQLLLTM